MTVMVDIVNLAGSRVTWETSPWCAVRDVEVRLPEVGRPTLIVGNTIL